MGGETEVKKRQQTADEDLTDADIDSIEFSGVLYEGDERHIVPTTKEFTKSDVPMEIIWDHVIKFIILHLLGFYGIYVFLRDDEHYFRNYAVLYGYSALLHLGATAGYHRMWTHKAFKANVPFKVLLALLSAGCGMNDAYLWARDHRVHHKFSETHADPHNANRGFFFAHMGWLMCKRHPDIRTKGQTVDMSDLLEDPVVVWQMKYFWRLFLLMGVIVPVVTYHYVLGMYWQEAFFMGSVWMWIQGLHQTWLANSAAHIWGPKPYDTAIRPAENLWVSILDLGEGWHNFHHTFPWDYKTSEMGFYHYNITTMFIDFFAWIGWAYDLKTVSKDVIKQRVNRTGRKSEWVGAY